MNVAVCMSRDLSRAAVTKLTGCMIASESASACAPELDDTLMTPSVLLLSCETGYDLCQMLVGFYFWANLDVEMMDILFFSTTQGLQLVASS